MTITGSPPSATEVSLDARWAVAPVRGIIHHTAEPVTRPGGPHVTDCGLSKRLAPAAFFVSGDKVCAECAECAS